MKVHQLIALLMDHDPQLDVVIAGEDRIGWIGLADARKVSVVPVRQSAGDYVDNDEYAQSVYGDRITGAPLDVIALD